MLVRIVYRRHWWFSLVREPLLLGVRILAWRHGIDARNHKVNNPECHGCIHFMKLNWRRSLLLFASSTSGREYVYFPEGYVAHQGRT
jgi:hypothetical protein